MQKCLATSLYVDGLVFHASVLTFQNRFFLSVAAIRILLLILVELVRLRMTVWEGTGDMGSCGQSPQQGPVVQKEAEVKEQGFRIFAILDVFGTMRATRKHKK